MRFREKEVDTLAFSIEISITAISLLPPTHATIFYVSSLSFAEKAPFSLSLSPFLSLSLTYTVSLTVSRNEKKTLTAIKGFMSASAMPLSSVTPWKVDRSHLYSREKQGDTRKAPTKKRRGLLE